MIITTFILFLLFTLFSSWSDRLVFKNSGWLYFISHYQIFMFGVVSLFFLFFLWVVVITYSLFFNNSIYFFISLFVFILLFPYSLDSISYGLFGSSFFFEKFFYHGKNLLGEKKSFLYSFCNFYVRFLYFIFALIFFLLAYCFLFCCNVFFIWCCVNKKDLYFIFIFILDNNLFSLFLVFLFLIPYFIETFHYSFSNTSFFKNFFDY